MSDNGIFGMMSISASGLRAQRMKMNALAENLANVSTTQTEDGGPYLKNEVRFTSTEFSKQLNRELLEKYREVKTTHPGHLAKSVLPDITGKGKGCAVDCSIVKSENPGKLVYEPTHPDADENGYVLYPDINVVTEMVDMMSAARAYEANVTAIEAAKAMAKKALEI